MKHEITVLFLAACILLTAGCAGSSSDVKSDEAGVVSETVVPTVSDTTTGSDAEGIGQPALLRELLECRYYVERDFPLYIDRAETYETSGGVLCGVAPHHLAAGHFIAGMYKTAAESGRKIDTVVLCAPRHYNSEKVLITSDSGWMTPFGVTDADTEVTALFREKLGAKNDDEMMQFDHSASSHIPFINYYLPDAKVACLLVSPDAGEDFPERLAETLRDISETKNCLFAFSIDFSHYLSPDKADMHDRETRAAVLSGDTDTIEHFGNNNVDTPKCLSAFVKLSQLLGGTVTEADNANTYTVGDMPYNDILFPEGVTSYFVWLTE